MICADARSMMIDALYGELASDADVKLTAHVANCPNCRHWLESLRSVFGTMDRWVAPRPTGRIAPRALKRVIVDELMPVSMERTAAPYQPALCRFWASFGGLRQRWVAGMLPHNVRTTAQLAFTAAGIAVALRLWLPITSVVEICDRWIHTSLGLLPFALVLLLLAAASSAAPLFVGNLIFLQQGGAHRFSANAMCFAIYAAVVAALVYVQCRSLPLAIQGLWIGGTVLGVALASAPRIRWASRRLARVGWFR